MPIYRTCKENILPKCQLNSWLNVSLKNLEKKNSFEIAETPELPRIKLLQLQLKSKGNVFFVLLLLAKARRTNVLLPHSL